MAIVRTLMAVIHAAVILAGREKIVIKVNWLVFNCSYYDMRLYIERGAIVDWFKRLLCCAESRWTCVSSSRDFDILRLHGDPTDMRESTSVLQIRTINRSELDKSQVSVIDSRRK